MNADRVVVRVVPPRALRVASASDVPHRRMLGEEPLVVLGADRVPSIASAGVPVDAQTCFGPRGAVLIEPQGPLWICDTGHHRMLGWHRRPDGDRAAADWVIGQPDFAREGRNAKGEVNAASLNVPTGISGFGDSGLAVADAWNHRILVWTTRPTESHVPADLVLGQPDFKSGEPNRGRGRASADTLFWPYGVACFGGRLFVADAENRRVLVWNELPWENGQPADLVLGQTSFEDRDENGGRAADDASMRWPHGISAWRDHLAVADAGNNRIMVWRSFPTSHGQRADALLGQPSAVAVDHNQSLYWPRADTLNMPYAVASSGDWLLVSDTASSRLVGWHIDDLRTGSGARALAGQADFHDKGDNRWMPPIADSLCWPYGITVCGPFAVVADSGNNRVSVWELAL
jgi:hypothetical protein